MATIVNACDVALQATSPRMVTTATPTNWQFPWGQVTGSGKPSDNADVTVTAVNGGITVTGGGITLSSGGSIKGGQTAYATGTGFFLGYSSSTYRFSIGSSTKYLRWDGSSLTLRGDISGASNIDITGTANFDGVTTSGSDSGAIVANSSLGADFGVIAQGPEAGVLGMASQSSAVGVHGLNLYGGIAVLGDVPITGTGVKGAAPLAGVGIEAYNASSSGIALSISNGRFQFGGKQYAAPDGSTYKFMDANGGWSSLGALASGSSTGTAVLTGKPGSSTNSVFIAINIGGTTYDFVAFPRA